MFKNVLVGVDGRANGRDAIALASQLVARDARLTLAHVRGGGLRPFQPLGPALLVDEAKASRELLEREGAAAGVDAELVGVVAASPGRGLHQQAERQGADLLVVGSCSRGLLGRAVLGDDARAALDGAPCAIAIASRGYADGARPIDRIGVGLDGSHESEAALARARELAGERKASVSALEVVTIPPVMYTGLMPPLAGESIDALLEEATGRMQGLPDVAGRAVYGIPGEELAAFGDELDLLVVGSRNYGPVRRMVAGSTCDYLERHARCSLLVFPRTTIGSSKEGDCGAHTEVPTTA